MCRWLTTLIERRESELGTPVATNGSTFAGTPQATGTASGPQDTSVTGAPQAADVASAPQGAESANAPQGADAANASQPAEAGGGADADPSAGLASVSTPDSMQVASSACNASEHEAQRTHKLIDGTTPGPEEAAPVVKERHQNSEPEISGVQANTEAAGQPHDRDDTDAQQANVSAWKGSNGDSCS